jgi:phospholipid transport system substrate-binding protein
MRLMSKTFLDGFLIACIAGALSVPALAQANSVTPGAALSRRSMESIQTPAGNFVQNMGKETLDVIDDEKLTLDQQKEKYRKILQTYFNLPTIARFVIGRAWNTATPEQQQEYMKLFESTVVKIYSDRLTGHKGEKSLIINSRRESDSEYIVSSQIMHPDRSPPTKVDWRVENKEGKFAILDVSIEGVSQAITKREEYASIIQRDGGMDGLLTSMRAHLKD